MRQGGTCRGGRLPIIWGGQIEQLENKNRESDGALIFDGFQWMGDTTTNRESAQSTEYSLLNGITGR
jgi:hypothetical protein